MREYLKNQAMRSSEVTKHNMEDTHIRPPEPPIIETYYNSSLPKLRIKRFRSINSIFLALSFLYSLIVIFSTPSTSLTILILLSLITSFGLVLLVYFQNTQDQDFTEQKNIYVVVSSIAVLVASIQISGGIASPFLFFYALILIYSGLTIRQKINYFIFGSVGILLLLHALTPSINVLEIRQTSPVIFFILTWAKILIIGGYALSIILELIKKDEDLIQANINFDNEISKLKKFNLLTKTYQSLSTLRGTLNLVTLTQLVPMTVSKLLDSEVTLFFLADSKGLNYVSSWSKKTESVVKGAPFDQCSINHGTDCIINRLKDINIITKLEAKEFFKGCNPKCVDILSASGAKHFVISPLKVTNTNLGVIIMGFSEKREFQWDEIEVLRIFSYTTVLAIENARYYSKTREDFERYNAILTELIDAVVVVDKNNKIIFFNEQAEKLIGLKASDVVGKQVNEVLFSLEETGVKTPKEKTAIFNALNSREVIIIPKRFYKKPNGDLVAVRVSAKSFRDENGVPMGVMLLITDLSEQFEFERSRNEFISVASRELKTPISDLRNIIKGIKHDKSGKLSVSQRNFIDLAFNANERLNRLVEDLLRVAQIEKGGVRVAKRRVDLSLITKTAVEDFIYQTKRKKLRLSYESLKKPLKVKGDPTHIREILAILLGNALKYTKANGQISVSHKVERGKIVTFIKDSGPPIPKEVIPDLFNKFYRDPKVANKIEGTGLGLYIVKQLVELMGGKVGVESNSKIGVIFSFSLPKAK